jgi:integrase/recombinase XerD
MFQINCTHCSKSFPIPDWDTELNDLKTCPGCGMSFIDRAISSTMPNGQEIYSREITVIERAPAIIERTGAQGKFAWDEFFSGILANKNTRRSYKKSVLNFLDFIDKKNIELNDVMAGHVREYFDLSTLQLSSQKQTLAALRHFFDVMVTRHALILNPAASVRLERMVYTKGKTKPLTPEDARKAIAAIELKTVRDLRDRSILGILTYTACRISALRKLDFKDFVINGYDSILILQEKRGQVREIPVRNDLRKWLDEYINFSGIEDGPLFRGSMGNSSVLLEKRIAESTIKNIISKRLDAVHLVGYSAHSFRAGTATALLEQLPSDDVQNFLGHADPRTTQLYDHRDKAISQNLVERI